MEVEHSRLLRFFKEARKYKPEMAESQEIPAIKITKDYQNPPNVEAEVPGTQKIREYDEKDNSFDAKITGGANNSYDTKITDDANNSSTITVTGADFTLSPVITVTKNESTFTKGDLKLQKVTVTEDIADEGSKNGGYSIPREVETLTQTDGQSDCLTIATRERDTTNMEGEEKSQDEKKSKIPMMRLKQAAEKVKREREARKEKEKDKDKPRRSSIPTLKDHKKVIKRDASLNFQPAVDDEFDKLYEEIVDNKQKDIEEKLPSVTMEDPEKIETKFEEIIHAYDEDEHEKHSIARVSKIPALIRKDEDGSSRITAMIDRAKVKTVKTETQLKDGGFKVTASSIKTKRFSRGSRDLSGEEQHVEITETIDIKEGCDNEVFVKETVKTVPAKPGRFRNISKRVVADQKTGTVETTEVIEDSASPATVTENSDKKDSTQNKTKRIIRTMSTERKERNLNRELSRNLENIRRKFRDQIEDARIDPEFMADDNHIIETTVTEINQDIPVKTEKIVRGISREMSIDGKNINTTEKVTIVQHNNGESRTITTFASEIPVRTEKIVRGISREMSIDGNIHRTETVTVKELNNGKTRTISKMASEIPVRTEKVVRGIARDMSIDDKNIKSIETVVIEENNQEIPVETEKTVRGISREMSKDGKSINSTETVTVEELNDGGTRTVTTKTTESLKIGTPVVTEKVIRNISREITTESQNNIIGVTTIEETRDSGKKAIKETHVRENVSGIPVKTERFTRGISREMGNINLRRSREFLAATEAEYSIPSDNKQVLRQESMKTEQIEKEGINVGIPVFTKITRSFSKGRIQNVEMSRTIEWQPAAEVKTKNFSRSVSEKVTKKELKDTGKWKYEIPTAISEVTGVNNTLPEKTDITSKDPALESKIKDSVKDIASKLTSKKVTEYKTEEQVTNVEKTTYTLNSNVDLDIEKDIKASKEIETQMSLNGKAGDRNYKFIKEVGTQMSVDSKYLDSPFDRDFKLAKESIESKSGSSTVGGNIKTSKDIGTQMSVVGKIVDKDFKISKEIGTQMSLEGTKLIENSTTTKQTNVTDTIHEKSEKENTDLPTEDKDSDNEGVTILKGNVSRLKDKIAKKSVVVSKKDPDEELPKKKTILSKIALFERLEPNEPYPVKAVPQPKVNVSKIKQKYTPPDLSRLNSVDRPKIVDEILKEPTQHEPTEVTSKVEISPNYDEVTFRSEALSSKEYWRNEKRYGQNDLKRLNTETIEETSLNQQDLEPVKVLPEIVDFKTQESQIEITKSVVNKAPIQKEDSVIEMPTIFPARTNYEKDIGKIKPGKIDLDVWSSHVEINKHSIDRVDLFREESLIEISQTLPGKTDFKTNDSHVPVSKELPGTVGLTENDNQTHAVTILPAKIDFNSEEIAHTLIKRLDSQIDDSRAGVSESLIHDYIVEDVRPLPEIINFKSLEIQAETASTPPGNTDTETAKPLIGHTAIENTNERPKELTNIKENLKPKTNQKEVNAKLKPGKINFSLWQNQVEVNKTLVGKTDLRKAKDAEIAKALSGRVDFKPKRKPRVTETVQSRNVLSSKENKAEIAITSTGQVDQSLSRSLSKEASILPGKLESDETKTDSAKSLVGFVDVNSNETEVATVKTLPEMVSFASNQVEVAMALLGEINNSSELETPTILSAKIELEPEFVVNESRAEVNETLPDNIYFSSTEYQTVKPTTLSTQNSVERVGKLDLKAWEHQVEVNKTLVDKTNVVKGEHLEEIANILPDKVNFITYETRVGKPRTFQAPVDLNADEYKVEITEIDADDEVPKILPEPIDLDPFKHTPRIDPITMLKRLNSQENIDFKGNVTKVQFPIESNPEPEPIDLDPFKHTPRINPITMLKRLNSQENMDLKGNVVKVEFPMESNPETLSDPELIEENPIEYKQKRDAIIGNVKTKLYFITNNNSSESHIKTPLNTPMPLESDGEHSEKRVEEIINLDFVGLPPNETDTWTYINSATAKSYEITADTIEENNVDNINDDKNYSVAEYDLDFDTFQVQSEFKSDPFVLDNLITSLTDLPHTAADRNKTHNNKYVTNELGFNFDIAKAGNQLSRSAYGDDFKKSTEELKRAKSLAELDVGEVVHGQVKRIVGRIKSVDFSRRESVKTEINVKELPRKMSVIEKIALFEGKTARARYETTTRKTSTTKPSAAPVISEEDYLRKIEEITVGKTKFGRLEDMLYLPLADGTEIPVLALGTALVDPRLLPYLIGAAIDLGYRAIDTAYIYGNEKEIGQAIKAKIDDGTVKREDLYIISKLWSTFHRSDLVEVACRASLENMGLDYFDLYLIHNPMSFKEGSDPIPKIATVLQYSQSDYLDAWFGMEGLVAKGLVKSIGVSNFNSQQIQRILDKGKLKPVVNQVECHPYLSQQRLHNFCAERNIMLSCFGVLGSKGTPAEYKNSTTAVIDDALVKVMASGLGVSPAQLLIRYQIESGHNVVVKASSAAHMWDNLQALTFTLDKLQIDALHALNKNKRTFTFKGMGDTHKNYPFLSTY